METITIQVNSHEILNDFLENSTIEEIASKNIMNVVAEKVSAEVHEKVEAVIKCALLKAGINVLDLESIKGKGLWQVKDGYRHFYYNGERIISFTQTPEMTTDKVRTTTATINWY